MRRLPTFRLESPCQESWSAMPARGEGRHCDRCATTVIDLSRMTRSQAESVVTAHGGKVCGRVRANAAGQPVFAPEPVKRGLVPVALAGLLAACSASPEEEPTPSEVTLTADPPQGDLGLALPTSGSFGGSLATGAMMPIGPDTTFEAPPPPSVVVASLESPPADDSVIPTDEQRALTRRKHQHHVLVSPPPPHHMLMGGISMHRD